MHPTSARGSADHPFLVHDPGDSFLVRDPGDSFLVRDAGDLSRFVDGGSRVARSSAIREILQVVGRPGVLSLAGGMPSPEVMPTELLAESARRAIVDDADRALQYARTEGVPELRAWLAERAEVARSRTTTPDHVLVTTGSQQALDLIARTLLHPGVDVVIEEPGYLGALQAMEPARPRWHPIPVDDDGLDVDALDTRLRRGLRPRLVYTVTDFQNPGGVVLSAQRRVRLAELADEFDFLVVEDDPYGAIRFDAPTAPPIAAWTDRALTLGTWSKTLSPGLRVGWVIGDPVLLAAMARTKQAVDLNTSALSQYVGLGVVDDPAFERDRPAQLTAFYRPRAEALHRALVDAIGDLEVRPARGGLFLWARLPEVDAEQLLRRAVERGVAFVPGAAFAVAGAGTTDTGTTNTGTTNTGTLAQHLRLSFATLSPADLAEAARRLSAAVNDLRSSAAPPAPAPVEGVGRLRPGRRASPTC